MSLGVGLVGGLAHADESALLGLEVGQELRGRRERLDAGRARAHDAHAPRPRRKRREPRRPSQSHRGSVP